MVFLTGAGKKTQARTCRKVSRSVVEIAFGVILKRLFFLYFLLQSFLNVGESKSARCDDVESLKKKKCKEMENPRGSIAVTKNKSVTIRNKDVNVKLKPEEITQIQPQKLTLTLRSGTQSVEPL